MQVNLINKNGVSFVVDEKMMDDILSAEFIIEKPFNEFEGTPEEYVAKVTEIIGEPKYPEIGKEGIVLGWLLFNGVRKFGIEYLNKILKEDDAYQSVIYMLVAQSEALVDQSSAKENNEIITSESGINE